MRIEGAMRQAGGLHDFGHAYVLKSPFTEQAGGLLHNPFMFRSSLFNGVAHNVFSASSMYDDHHITYMTDIIFDASHTKRRHYEAHREEGSYYRREQRHRSGHGPSFHCERRTHCYYRSRPEDVG